MMVNIHFYTNIFDDGLFGFLAFRFVDVRVRKLMQC